MYKLMTFIVFFVLSGVSCADDLPGWMKESGWVLFENVCQSANETNGTNADCSEGTLVTGTSSLSPWAGETSEMYFDKGSNSFTRLKIKITWTSEGSPYNCGEVIMMKPDETRDFTHRSLAMSECN